MDEPRVIAEPRIISPNLVKKRARFDLLEIPLIRGLARNRYFPLTFQVLTFLILGYALWEGFFGTQSGTESFTTQILYFAFWPLTVLFTVPLIGRMWCGVCPLGAVSAAVERFGLQKPVPRLLRNLALPVFLFVGLVWWLEPVSGISNVPNLTALFFGFWLFLGVISGLLFKKRAWCRFFCPIAPALSVYSSLSFLTLQSKREICKGCSTMECVRGNGETQGCPMYEFPGNLEDARNCNYCLNCVKSCSKNGIALRFRFPGSGMVNLRKPQMGEVASVIAVVAVFPVMMTLCHAWNPPWLTDMAKQTNAILGLESGAVDGVKHTISLFFGIGVTTAGLVLAAKLSSFMSGVGFSFSLRTFGLALVPQVLFAQYSHILATISTEGWGPIEAVKSSMGIFGYRSLALLDEAGIAYLRGEVGPMLTRLGAVATLVMIFLIAGRLNLSDRRRILAATPFAILVLVLIVWQTYGRAAGMLLRAAGMPMMH